MMEDILPSGPATSQDNSQLILVHKESRSWYVSENLCSAMVFTSSQDKTAHTVRRHVGTVGDPTTGHPKTPVVGYCGVGVFIDANRLPLQVPGPLVFESSTDAAVPEGSSDSPKDGPTSEALPCIRGHGEGHEVAPTSVFHVQGHLSWLPPIS